MSVYEKEVYENGTAALHILKGPRGTSLWVQSGITGMHFTHEELEALWPLLEAYAEDFGLGEKT